MVRIAVHFRAHGATVFQMRADQQNFLSLPGQLPARLTVVQAAWVLNCQPHDIPVLVFGPSGKVDYGSLHINFFNGFHLQ
jgi:hypothetical protein